MRKFQPYPWHQQSFQHLQDVLQQDRLAHAILFSGPSGIGKRHFVNCLVYNVLQRGKVPSNFDILIDACTHPDVQRISLKEDKKQISVDQIRELSSRLSLTPQLSHIKIVVIEEADLMTVAASNALLKTLEEPSGDALIILLSQNHGRLPQTIQSRCQHISLSIPSSADVSSWLEASGVDEPQIYLELFNGAPLAAKYAAENERLQQFRQLLNDLQELLASRLDIVSASQQWRDYDGALLIDWIQQLIKILIKLKLGIEITSNMAANFLRNLKIPYDAIDLRTLFDYSSYLDKCTLELGNNLNREMFLEQIFSRWASMSPSK